MVFFCLIFARINLIEMHKMKNSIIVLVAVVITSCASKTHLHKWDAAPPEDVTEVSISDVNHPVSGSYIYVNQTAYEVKNTLNEVLNPILREYEGKTVVVEFNTAEYKIDSSIVLPSKIRSRVIIKGNHATIFSTIPSEDYAFSKPCNRDFGLTGAADTYQEIRDLTIKGSGGGVKLAGGYQSKVINIMTKQMSRGVLMEFVLQGKVEDCHIVHPKEFGIKLNTIPGTGENSSQCNLASVINCRVLVKDTEVGIYVGNSNLVRLDGNIIEGGKVNKAVYFHNGATTVVQFDMVRTHFECHEYSEACLYFDGFISHLNVSQMYYSGIYGTAIKSGCKRGYSKIYLNDIGWTGHWKFETSPYTEKKTSPHTWWFFDNIETKDVKSLFKDVYPFYVFKNQARFLIH